MVSVESRKMTRAEAKKKICEKSIESFGNSKKKTAIEQTPNREDTNKSLSQTKTNRNAVCNVALRKKMEKFARACG